MTYPLDPLRAVGLTHRRLPWLGAWLIASLGLLACAGEGDGGDAPPLIIVPGGDSGPPPVMVPPDAAVDDATVHAADAAPPDSGRADRGAPPPDLGPCGAGCPGARICTPDGCVDCVGDGDCPDPQVCRAGACAPQCTEDTDCRPGLCEDARCVPVECANEAGCPQHQMCDEGRCSRRRCSGSDSTCPGESICVGRTCRPPECEDAGDCFGDHICYRRRCSDDPPPCDGINDCLPDASCVRSECRQRCSFQDDCADGMNCLAGYCYRFDGLFACHERQLLPVRIDGAAVVRPADGRLPAETEGTCGGGGWEFAAQLDVPDGPEPRTLCAFTIGQLADTVLYVRTACGDGDSEVACNDDHRGATSQVQWHAEPGATYFVYVDQPNRDRNPAQLVVRSGPCPEPDPPVCATADACRGAEQCRDGACVVTVCAADDDCREGWRCDASALCSPIPPPPECAVDDDCPGSSDICRFGDCVQPPPLACDDDADCRRQRGERTCRRGLCADPPPDSCARENLLRVAFDGRHRGTTVGGGESARGTCGGRGAEVVYEFRAGEEQQAACLQITGEQGTVMHARTACDAADSEIGCSAGRLEFLLLPGEVLYVFVDSAADAEGPYTIESRPVPCPFFDLYGENNGP